MYLLLQITAAFFIVAGIYSVIKEIYMLIYKDKFRQCTLICCGEGTEPEELIRYACEKYGCCELYIQTDTGVENARIIKKLAESYDIVHTAGPPLPR